MEWHWRLMRYGLAAYFGSVGTAVLLYHAGVVRLPQLESEPAAIAFLKAMTNTGYVNQLLSVSFIVGATALLKHQWAPLGIAILAPSVAGILGFHLMLSGRILWGLLWTVWLLALAWRYRHGFRGLWAFADAEGQHR